MSSPAEKVYHDEKLVGWSAICDDCGNKFYVRRVPVYLGERNTEDEEHATALESHKRCIECLDMHHQLRGISQEQHETERMKRAKRRYSTKT